MNNDENQNVDRQFDSENAWFYLIHSAYVYVHKKHATFLYIDFTREVAVCTLWEKAVIDAKAC